MILALRRRWWRRRVAAATSVHDFLAAPLPSRRAHLAEVPLLALDFETTGLEPTRDRIVSAGWLRLEGGALRVADGGELRLAGERSVGSSATIHGLRDMDLEGGVDEMRLLASLLPALTGRVLLAHGAGIEQRFLDAAMRRSHLVPFLWPSVCTLSLERRLREQNGHLHAPGALTLAQCRARYGLPVYREHDALSDALACAELFLAQVQAMGGFAQVRLGAVLG